MRAKIVFSSAFVAVMLGLAPAWAQAQSPGRVDEPLPPPGVMVPAQPQPPVEMMSPPAGLSNWITYNRAGIDAGPMGNSNPMMSELFLRSGVVVATGATQFGRTLTSGWEIQGGGRMLFFNSPLDRAWTIELSISNQNNSGQHRDITFPLSVFQGSTLFDFGTGGRPGVTIRNYNRTFVNFGPGREWYIWGPSNPSGRMWRIGVDGGGRWGTAKLELNEIRHRTDTLGGLYLAAHTDLEVPFGSVTLMAGIREEIDYTWGDILQTASDIMGFNTLVTLGFRF